MYVYYQVKNQKILWKNCEKLLFVNAMAFLFGCFESDCCRLLMANSTFVNLGCPWSMILDCFLGCWCWPGERGNCS